MNARGKYIQQLIDAGLVESGIVAGVISAAVVERFRTFQHVEIEMQRNHKTRAVHIVAAKRGVSTTYVFDVISEFS